MDWCPISQESGVRLVDLQRPVALVAVSNMKTNNVLAFFACMQVGRGVSNMRLGAAPANGLASGQAARISCNHQQLGNWKNGT